MDRRAWLLAVGVLLASCGPARQDAVTVDGSSTAFPLVNILAEEFGEAHPRIEVVANKCGTGGGLQRLARGEIDVAAASRRAEPGEALGMVEIPLALDGVTVIVNPANPVQRLSLTQLRRAWAGAESDWGGLGGAAGRIVFYGPAAGHGTRMFFAAALGCGLRRDVQEDQDYNVVVRSVAEDPRGIGYVGYDYYAANRDRLRAVAIDGVVPSEGTIADGSYRPLSRPLYLYVSRRALQRPAVRDFVAFVRGPSGRAAAREARVVPW